MSNFPSISVFPVRFKSVYFHRFEFFKATKKGWEKRVNLSFSIIQGCRLWPDGGLQQDGGLLWDLWRQQLLSKEVWLDRGRLVPLLKTLWRRLQNGQISVSKYSDSRNGGGWFLQSIGKTRFADGPLQRPPLSRQVAFSPEYLAFHWLKGQGKKCIDSFIFQMGGWRLAAL